MKRLRANLFISPITILVGTVVTIILALCKAPWMNYLIGIVVGLLTHGLFIKMNMNMVKKMELDPEGKIYDPRRASIINSLIRITLVVVVFAVVIFTADVNNNSNAVWEILCTFFGYLTFRIVMILCFIIFKEKEDDSE